MVDKLEEENPGIFLIGRKGSPTCMRKVVYILRR